MFKNRNINLLFIKNFHIAIAFFIFGNFLSIVLKNSGYNETQIGILFSISGIIAAIFSFILPSLVAKIRTKFLIVTGLVLLSLGIIIILITTTLRIINIEEFLSSSNFSHLLNILKNSNILFVFSMVGYGIYIIGAVLDGYITGIFIPKHTKKEDTASFFSLNTILQNIGSLLAGIILIGISFVYSFLSIDSKFHYNFNYLFVSVLVLLLIIIILFMKKEDLSEKATGLDIIEFHEIIKHFKNMQFGLYGKIFLFGIFESFAEIIFSTYMGLFIFQRFNTDLKELSGFFMILSISGIIGNFLTILLKKVRSEIIIPIFQILSGIVVFLFIISANLYLAAAFAMIRMMVRNALGPKQESFIMNYLPEHERPIFGSIRMIVYSPLNSIIIIICGVLITKFGYFYSFFISSSFYILTGIIFFILFTISSSKKILNQKIKDEA